MGEGVENLTPMMVEPMMALFDGNKAGYGQHTFDDNMKCSNWTITGEVPVKAFSEHLAGTVGLGIVPIRLDSRCMFACIDYDAHHTETDVTKRKDVNLAGIDKQVAAHGLPLIVCRSKSGGAHLFVFFKEPIPAIEAKNLMMLWAKHLGLAAQAEIFPKQIYLGEGQIGNTINIPYFGADETNRYALHNGKKLNCMQFIETANDNRIDRAAVKHIMTSNHPDAPPCIQRMIREGVASGNRNEAMYNITIYMRKRDPLHYKDEVIDLNSTVLNKPLPIRELRRTITSASNKDYKYRCKEAPCRDLCDKEVCLTRTYGIQPDDLFEDDDIYGRLIKHKTEPVQWVLYVKGRPVTVNTHILMDHRRLMEVVADVTTTVIPIIKPVEWMRKLSDLMEHASEENAPSDATVGGALMGKLAEFIKKARAPLTEQDIEAKVEQPMPPGYDVRDALHRGQPTAEYNEDGECVVHFRGKDFLEYLKRTRHGDVRGATVWMELRKSGVATGKIRVGRSVLAVWSVKATVDEARQIVPSFKRVAEF